MSSPSSPMEVATSTLKKPLRKSSIICFCSFWERPVSPFFCWPTNIRAETPWILFSFSTMSRALSRYWLKTMTFADVFSLMIFSRRCCSSTSLGCSIFSPKSWSALSTAVLKCSSATTFLMALDDPESGVPHILPLEKAEAFQLLHAALQELLEGPLDIPQHRRELDLHPVDLHLLHVGPDVRVAVRPHLDGLNEEVLADVLDLLHGRAGGGGHASDARIPRQLVVLRGDEDIGVVAHRAVRLIEAQQGDLLKPYLPGDDVILQALGREHEEDVGLAHAGRQHDQGVLLGSGG